MIQAQIGRSLLCFSTLRVLLEAVHFVVERVDGGTPIAMMVRYSSSRVMRSVRRLETPGLSKLTR